MNIRCPRKIVRNLAILFGVILLIAFQVTLYLRYFQHASFNSSQINKFLIPQRIVHLDFKGGPPKLSFFRRLLPLLSSAGATGVIVEYEDYFPYSGTLRNLSSRTAWSPAEVQAFLDVARAARLQVIPLVQTLGHLEFALKLADNVHLRENPSLPDTACPSEPATHDLISEMIRQVLLHHPQSTAIHLGMDEARLSKHCRRCLFRQGGDVLVEHIIWVARKALQLRSDMRLLIWDDMFRYWPLERMFGVAEVWRMVQPVVWAYSRDVIIEIPARTWLGYQRTMPNLWIASSYMGADGHTALTPNISERLHNHIAWLQRSSSTLISSTRSKSDRALISSTSSLSQVSTMVLTGWARYDHFGALCENLPLGVHSLLLMLSLVSAATPSDPVPTTEAAVRWKNLLNCPQQVPLPIQQNLLQDPFLWSAASCSYPGSDLLRIVQRPVPAGLKYSTTQDPKGPQGPKYMPFEEYQDLVEKKNRSLRESGHLPEDGSKAGVRSLGPGGGHPPAITSKNSNKCKMNQAQANITAKQLVELQEKHPYLFNVLKSCPPDDLINEVFNDRYRSTYMIDYGKDAEYPNLEYDQLVAMTDQDKNQALAFCPGRDDVRSKYPNDTGVVSVSKRGHNNECDALIVHKPQKGMGVIKGEEGEGGKQNEVCICGEAIDTPRYGRHATISKMARVPEEGQTSKSGDTGGWVGCGRGGGGVGSSGLQGGSAGGGGGGAGGGRRGKIVKLSYSTEYKDAFGRIGELIISSRLHNPRE